MKKIKLTSLLTTLVIIINIFPVCIATADTAMSISTVSDFNDFMEKCVFDDYSKDKIFVLQNDIDLSGVEIKSAEVFCGVFEGGGHTIKNVDLSFGGGEKGLFNSLTKDAQIKDLNVTGEIKSENKNNAESIIKQRAESILERSDIDIDNTDSGLKAVGGIAGYNAGKIINCSFSGNISAKKQAGGIAGYNAMTGVIDSCVNNASVSGDSEIGGIAGYNEGRIKLSKNRGEICQASNENTVNVGGICGNNKGAVVICANEGHIGGESFGDNIGGICGRQSGEIRESINQGIVRGRRSVGGICGRFEPYTDIDLSYESAKASIKKQTELFKNDISGAKSKILDYAVDLLTGAGDFSTVMSLLGLSDSVSGLRNLTDSAINMFDSIANAVDSANSSNLTSSLRDTVDKLGSFSDETKESVRNVSDSLNTSLRKLDDFLNEFDGKGDELTTLMDNLNDAVEKGEDDVDDIKSKLTKRLDDFEESADDVLSELDRTNTELKSTLRQLRNTTGEIGDSITEPLEKLERAINNAEKEFKALKKKIEDFKNEIANGGIKDKIEALPTIRPLPTMPPSPPPRETESGYSADPNTELDSSGYDVEIPVAGAVLDFLFPTAYAEKESFSDDDNETAISNIKSTDISLPRLIGDENADTALIRYCINNGTVEGNELTGGVAGCTGFESVVRTGESLKLPDGTLVSSDSVLKAVIDSCISCGNITAKANYAGGICGRIDIGNIKNSLTTGEINVSDGAYAGGTVGQSGGDIENCIAVNDLYGDNHIGGIAGSGKNIKSSYALPRIYGANDKSGAIAGFITGELNDSYFIDEGLAGIDGANLAGKAEAVSPENIAAYDGVIPASMQNLSADDFYMESGDLYMPQIKAIAQNDAENIGALLQSKSSELARFRFNVTFKDKDKELKTMTVDYGTVLQNSDIPKLTADGSDIPMWNKDPSMPIIRHTAFESVYNKATTTISTNETPALLLVESVFEDNTTVSAKEEEVNQDFDGYKAGKAYSFKLSKNAYDIIKVHIRDDSKKAAKIGVQIDGKWDIVDCSVDGSYAVFETKAPCRFVILYNRMSPLVPIGIGLGIILAAGVIVFIFRKVRGRNGRKTEENI